MIPCGLPLLPPSVQAPPPHASCGGILRCRLRLARPGLDLGHGLPGFRACGRDVEADVSAIRQCASVPVTRLGNERCDSNSLGASLRASMEPGGKIYGISSSGLRRAASESVLSQYRDRVHLGGPSSGDVGRSAAASTRNRGAIESVSASVGLTPTSIDCRTRVAVRAPRRPTMLPRRTTVIIRRIWRKTSRRGVAPSAMRMPLSRFRWDTTYDVTP